MAPSIYILKTEWENKFPITYQHPNIVSYIEIKKMLKEITRHHHKFTNFLFTIYQQDSTYGPPRYKIIDTGKIINLYTLRGSTVVNINNSRHHIDHLHYYSLQPTCWTWGQ